MYLLERKEGRREKEERRREGIGGDVEIKATSRSWKII